MELSLLDNLRWSRDLVANSLNVVVDFASLLLSIQWKPILRWNKVSNNLKILCNQSIKEKDVKMLKGTRFSCQREINKEDRICAFCEMLYRHSWRSPLCARRRRRSLVFTSFHHSFHCIGVRVQAEKWCSAAKTKMMCH